MTIASYLIHFTSFNKEKKFTSDWKRSQLSIDNILTIFYWSRFRVRFFSYWNMIFIGYLSEIYDKKGVDWMKKAPMNDTKLIHFFCVTASFIMVKQITNISNEIVSRMVWMCFQRSSKMEVSLKKRKTYDVTHVIRPINSKRRKKNYHTL